MASVKKVVKSKGAAKKWLWWYRLMAKILITTIQVNFVLIPMKLGWGNTNWPELLLLNFLPLTYTITAISWSPLYISHRPFWSGPHFFYCFEQIFFYTSIDCTIFTKVGFSLISLLFLTPFVSNYQKAAALNLATYQFSGWSSQWFTP